MINNRIKLFVIAVFVFPLAAVSMLNVGAVNGFTISDEEVVKTYKTKCAACHGPTALKSFDPEKAVAEHVEIILKGKKGAKPPFMPEYESKGMTVEQATALTEYMIELRAPADAQ